MEGIREMKWLFRWTRKEQVWTHRPGEQRCVFASETDESDRLVPQRLVDKRD